MDLWIIAAFLLMTMTFRVVYEFSCPTGTQVFRCKVIPAEKAVGHGYIPKDLGRSTASQMFFRTVFLYSNKEFTFAQMVIRNGVSV